MFDIGFPELVVIAVVGLLVIGPKRLPEALRTLGLWLGRMRRSFTTLKNEIEKEIGMDEVRRQLHNEAVMEEMKRIEREVKGSLDDATIHEPAAHASQQSLDDASTREPAAEAPQGSPEDTAIRQAVADAAPESSSPPSNGQPDDGRH